MLDDIQGTIKKMSDLGCEQFQGYYFAKPKTAKELFQYIAAQTSTKVHLIDKKRS